MSRKLIPFFLALGLVLTLPLRLPAIDTAPRFAHETSDLTVDPSVRWGRLDNGLRYAIRHCEIPKGRASLRFAVTTGSLQETDQQRGLAHFLEHLAFNGSTHFKPGTLIEFFQRMGMSFGGDTNAYTGFDRTVYMLDLPDTKAESLDQSFTLFADYAGGLLLEPHSIEKERGIILSEKRASDSAGERANEAEQKFIFPGSRIPARMPIGEPEVITHAQREQFVDYYDTWYRPESIIIVAVGDFDPNVVEALIRRHLGGLKARAAARPQPDLGKIAPPTNLASVAVRLYSDPELSATTVSIQSVVPYAFESDSKTKQVARLTRSIALGMLNRRLQILAKKKEAPFLGGGAGVNEEFDAYRNCGIQLTCKPEQWQAALGVAEQELRRVLQFGFDPAELKEVVAGVRNGLEQSVKQAANQSSQQIAAGLLETIITRAVFTSSEADAALLLPVLDRLTPDDCARALRQAWAATAARSIFISGNLKIADPEKTIAMAYATSTGVAVSAPTKIAESTFAYTDFGSAGKIKDSRFIEDLGIRQVVFENGVRLNLKRTDFEVGTIGMIARIGGGALTLPKDRASMAVVAGSVAPASGLGKHDNDELQRILAGKNVGLGFGIGGSAFELSGHTTPADLLLTLQLACAHLVDQGYRSEALGQFQRGLDPFYEGIAHAVEGPLQTQVPQLLAAGDPRRAFPSKETLLHYTIEDIRSWLDPELATGAIELSLIGDLDFDQVTAAVAQTFGALPSRQPKPDYTEARRMNIPEHPVSREFTVPTEIDRAIISFNWPVGDALNVPRARRVGLLTEVVKDRLRERLREKMGDTYSPSAGAALSEDYPGYGWLKITATVDPVKIPVVVTAVKELAAELAKEGVTADELERAKRPQATALLQAQRLNGYWLGVMARSQEYPWKLDAARTLLADWDSISKADVDHLATELLDPARASIFISKPAPKSP